MANWRTNLKKVVDDTKVGWSRLSKESGLNDTYLRDILKNDVEPTLSKFLQICHRLNVSIGELVDGKELPVPEIPVVGYASSGEEWHPVDEGGQIDSVPLNLRDADPIAIRVRGDSMLPVYRNGDEVICSRRHGLDIASALGKDCAIKTSDGRSYLKQLHKGRGVGFYRLRSYNNAYPDLEDQTLEWAAPVVWIHRRD